MTRVIVIRFTPWPGGTYVPSRARLVHADTAAYVYIRVYSAQRFKPQ